MIESFITDDFFTERGWKFKKDYSIGKCYEKGNFWLVHHKWNDIIEIIAIDPIKLTWTLHPEHFRIMLPLKDKLILSIIEKCLDNDNSENLYL